MNVVDLFYHRHLKRGIVLVLCAWFLFSTMFTLSKVIGPQTTVPTMLLFRNLVGMVISLPWVFRYWPKSLELKNVKIVVIRSLLALLSLFFILLAIKKITIVNTVLLQNSAPFFVPFILWF